MTLKRYRGAHADVTWDKEACIHAGECLRGLPEVFNTDKRPWILPDGATKADLLSAVALCPAGALEVAEPTGASQPEGEGKPADPAPAATIEVKNRGPLIVKGGCRVVSEDGTVLREGPVVALCRCGATAKAPFCDGAHAKIDWPVA